MRCEPDSCESAAELNNDGDYKRDLMRLSKNPSFRLRDILAKRLEKDVENRRCPDALSMYTLGDMGKDKLDSMSLRTTATKGEVTIHDLQSISKIKDTPKIILPFGLPFGGGVRLVG